MATLLGSQLEGTLCPQSQIRSLPCSQFPSKWLFLLPGSRRASEMSGNKRLPPSLSRDILIPEPHLSPHLIPCRCFGNQGQQDGGAGTPDTQRSPAVLLPHNHDHLFSRQLPSCVKYTEHKNPPTSKCCSRVLNTLAMLCGCYQHLYSSSRARPVPVRHGHPVFLPPWLYFLTVISQVWVPPVTGVRAEPVLFQHPQCSPVLCTDVRSPTL